MPAAATVRTRDLRSYLVGLGLALLLTGVPFGLVYFHALPVLPIVAVIALAAVAQVLVHLHYFLHVDFRLTPGENLVALFFTLFLILVMVGGSLWIMFDLHYRMAM
jgi:cytochrome o ubiquinol oxidase subunit IV